LAPLALVLVVVPRPLYILLAALSLFQLRSLLLSIQAASKLTVKDFALIKYVKPMLTSVTKFLESAFGGAEFSHLNGLTLNHYLVCALLFGIFTMTTVLRSATRR
jgi:hypothetical protein